MKVTISTGNSKIGKIANVSLTPLLSCNHDCDCKKGDCYALKAWRMYSTCREAWGDNLATYENKPVLFFWQIRKYIEKKKPNYFRWHVAGDIPDQYYFDAMEIIASRFPKTKFLAFTKRHDLNFDGLPENLKIIFSMWPNWGNTKKKAQRAWMQDGTETRIPADAVECSGKCDECLICWNNDADVVFAKH